MKSKQKKAAKKKKTGKKDKKAPEKDKNKKKAAKGKKTESKEEDYQCKWDIQHEYKEIRIVADCKECGGLSNLREGPCLKGVLDAVASESNTDSVTLSHYVETRYDGYSLELLKRMAQIMQELEQMAIRDSYKEYFGSDDNLSTSQKNQQRSACDKCEINPQKLFPGLRRVFTTDIMEFYKTYMDTVKKMDKGPTSLCTPCLKTSKSDIVYLFNSLEDLRAFIYYRGFNIVI